MDYMKFNCYDLAAQNTELHSVRRRMQSLAEELSIVLNSLDPQMKSYEGLYNQIMATGTATDDIAMRLLSANTALDQIIDLYFAAESRVTQSVEGLPVGISSKGNNRSNTNTDIVKVQTSSITSGDLIVEDWLAEMVYKFGK